MRNLLVAGAVAAATISLAPTLALMVATYRSRGESDATAESVDADPDADDNLQWIESGHRRILLDPNATEATDLGTAYPAHIRADAEAVVDLEAMQ
jgi:hypothetical protein